MASVTDTSTLGGGLYEFDITYDDTTFFVTRIVVKDNGTRSCQFNVYDSTGTTIVQSFTAQPGQTQTWNLNPSNPNQRFDYRSYTAGMIVL